MRGRLIVIYGVNNLGKSTQAKILVDKLKKEGKKAEYLKYPVYDLKPSGSALDAYLRQRNPDNLTPKDAQILYAKNREEYAGQLSQTLASGTIVIAEDYWGTGVAWGMGQEVDKDFLLNLNKQFRNEDLALLLEGDRFTKAVEDSHLHETDSELTQKVEHAHQELADEFGWIRVDANQSREAVAQDIWKKVQKLIK